MARPAARVLTLLELLQSGGVRTVAELADRLGVEGRTVRRYVDHLIDLHVPVEAVGGPGEGGGRGQVPPGPAGSARPQARHRARIARLHRPARRVPRPGE